MVGRLRAYLAVVSAVGLVVLALLAASVDLGRVRDSLPEGQAGERRQSRANVGSTGFGAGAGFGTTMSPGAMQPPTSS